MQTSLKQVLLELVDFNDAAVAGTHYADGSVVPELYWPHFIKHMRMLKNHVRENLDKPIDSLAAVPLRKISKLISRLEGEYEFEAWDGFDFRDPLSELPPEVTAVWSTLRPGDSKEIRRLVYEFAEASGNSIPLDPYDEVLALMNQDRWEVIWNKRVYRLESQQLFLVVRELAKVKGGRITNARIGSLDSELSGIEVKSFRRLKGKDDIAVMKWIQSSKSGFALRLPKRKDISEESLQAKQQT